MQKQDHKEQDSKDLLPGLAERQNPAFDETPSAGQTDAQTDDSTVPSSAMTAAQDHVSASEAPTPEEEPPAPPAEDRVFGMPRMEFWGVAGGFGLGYIINGLLDMTNLIHFGNDLLFGFICAVIGYLISSRIYKKQKRAAEQENKQNGQERI